MFFFFSHLHSQKHRHLHHPVDFCHRQQSNTHRLYFLLRLYHNTDFLKRGLWVRQQCGWILGTMMDFSFLLRWISITNKNLGFNLNQLRPLCSSQIQKLIFLQRMLLMEEVFPAGVAG
ncbi:unnamed protein product [Lactuca virosa]|uniref:Uncharacterized protein n=1 Tax=Lactuca virosa TaxID=75947 RepID=A0AAU9NPF5_9ASTR|nr:unnamed protein product [Lactuca virosa]CAH1444210.1 unnamed protein product [Lactuca virosa]